MIHTEPVMKLICLSWSLIYFQYLNIPPVAGKERNIANKQVSLNFENFETDWIPYFWLERINSVSEFEFLRSGITKLLSPSLNLVLPGNYKCFPSNFFSVSSKFCLQIQGIWLLKSKQFLVYSSYLIRLTIMDSENGHDEVDAIPECSKNSKEIETRIHEWTRCHEKII